VLGADAFVDLNHDRGKDGEEGYQA
jgi:hypothetical protein